MSKKAACSFWITSTLVGLLTSVPASYGQQPALADASGKPTLAPLMRRVTPAVVNIAVDSTITVERNPLFDDPFFRRFFEVPEQQGPSEIPQHAAGSGVIVDARDGYILTNHHVVENAERITVTLADRRQLSARLIGSDAGTDIALLQVEAERLTGLEFGDSDALEVGDYVVAIGNPFGLGQTVTSGIVSALGRSGLSIEDYEDFIQTDASINPGNSGGALVDLDGRLVGINSAIIAPGGGNVGIGFAVPSNMARSVMDQILQYGEVRRGRLGISIQNLTPELASALELDVNTGALVTEVQPGSAAERAGILAGDVITAVDGREITGSGDLRNRIGLTPVDEEVEITALRDGRVRQFRARILGETAAGAPPATPARVNKLEGAQFSNLPESHPLYGRIQGVLVVQVSADSPAWRAGLRQNDIILAVNRTNVGNVDQLEQALSSTQATFALNVQRGTARMYLIVR
jgi:serine protease DegQ